MNEELQLAVTLAADITGHDPHHSTLPFYLLALVCASLIGCWCFLLVRTAAALHRRLGWWWYSSIPSESQADSSDRTSQEHPMVDGDDKMTESESDARWQQGSRPNATDNPTDPYGFQFGMPLPVYPTCTTYPSDIFHGTPPSEKFEVTLYRVPGESLGMDLQLDSEGRSRWVITRLRHDSPAERSGQLRVGDVVCTIDGFEVSPDTQPAVLTRTRDEWRVRLGLLRVRPRW